MRADSAISVERVDFDNGWNFTYRHTVPDQRVFVEIYDGDSPITIARKLRQFADGVRDCAWPPGVPIG